MPVCPQCDNRVFANKEALLQHINSSSTYHPFCAQCDRRFTSQTAYDAHMAAKHPPTFDCTLCDRKYHAQFALDDHYRGSSAHPNCTRCGRGVRDSAALEEHHRTAHPLIPCLACGGKMFYEEALDQHYLESGNHATCSHCLRGFKDNALYLEHVSLVHPELFCQTCNRQFETAEAVVAHYSTSPAHLKCIPCNLGFKNEEEFAAHNQLQHATPSPVHSPLLPPLPLSPPVLEKAMSPNLGLIQRPESLYSTGFTPLSPTHRFKELIAGKRSDSPDLRLKIGFGSPIQNVQPLLSPASLRSPSLPRPGGFIDELWASRENVQVTTTRFINKPHGPASPPSSIWNIIPQTGSPSVVPAKSAMGSSHRSATMSQGSLSPTSTASIDVAVPDPKPTASSVFDFHPRLYPGSVRHAARTALRSSQSPPGSISGRSSSLSRFPLSARDPLSPDQSWNQGAVSSSGWRTRDPSKPFGISRLPGPSSSWRMREAERWREKEQEDRNYEITKEEETERHRERSTDRAQEYARFDSNSVFSEVSTPRVETPAYQLLSDNVDNSPSDVESFSSSPFREEAPKFEQKSTTRLTSPVSRAPLPPTLQVPMYTITPSSECGSPEVYSPFGLAPLPQVSPLASTPVDLATFDIPEAQRPLPDSPLNSPGQSTLNVDIHAGDLSLSSFSPASSSLSYTTSPQDPYPHIQGDIEPAVAERHDRDTEKTVLGEASSATQVDITEVPTTGESASSTLPTLGPLHCRVCHAETCDDITATMCGHIFCNRCITEVVIKSSRCPVCSTPTLLYCLFRLDIYT